MGGHKQPFGGAPPIWFLRSDRNDKNGGFYFFFYRVLMQLLQDDDDVSRLSQVKSSNAYCCKKKLFLLAYARIFLMQCEIARRTENFWETGTSILEFTK